MTERLENWILAAIAIVGIAALLFAWSTEADAFPRPDNPAPHARKHK